MKFISFFEISFAERSTKQIKREIIYLQTQDFNTFLLKHFQ